MTTGKPIDGAAAASGGPEGFAEAHRALLADSSIQFELPMHEPTPPPQWLVDLLSALAGGGNPALRGLLWLVLGAAALLILWLVVARLRGREWPWRRKPAGEDDSWRPDEIPARALLSEADALARQGRFSEAAHLLLFRSIDDIDTRHPDLVRPALTSRDIAALPAIPSRPRGAFARIAMLVERSLFARRPLGESDWRECRAAYEEFAFAGAWQ